MDRCNDNNVLRAVVEVVKTNNHMTQMANEGKLKLESTPLNEKYNYLKSIDRYKSSK